LGLRDGSRVLAVAEEIGVSARQAGADVALRDLLRDRNWRPHLVASVALLRIERPQPFLAELWSAIAGGSWVSPQLLVVAALRDPMFLARLRGRAEESFAVRRGTEPSALARHVASGPGSSHRRSGKELAAALALCDESPEALAVATDILARPGMQELLAADFDNGGAIATGWRARIRELLSGAGMWNE